MATVRVLSSSTLPSAETARPPGRAANSSSASTRLAIFFIVFFLLLLYRCPPRKKTGLLSFRKAAPRKSLCAPRTNAARCRQPRPGRPFGFPWIALHEKFRDSPADLLRRPRQAPPRPGSLPSAVFPFAAAGVCPECRVLLLNTAPLSQRYEFSCHITLFSTACQVF